MRLKDRMLEDRPIFENDKAAFHENLNTDVANNDIRSKGLKYKCFWVKLKDENTYQYVLVNENGVVVYETGMYESLGNMIDMLAFDKEYSEEDN